MPSLIRSAVIAASLAALLPVAAPGQLQSQLKPGPFRPGQLSRPMPRPQAEIVLRDLPEDMLRVAQDPDWPNPRRNAGSLGVSRTGVPMRTCRQPADSIDLRRVRANGFHVVSYQLTDAGNPSGYKVAGYSNVRPFLHPSPNSDRLVNAHNPAEIDTISITPQVSVLDVPVKGKVQRLACISGWTLEIRVSGPRGINPFTGRAA